MISWRLYTNSAVLILITLAWLIAKWITNLDVKKLSSFADPSDNGNYFNLRQWLPPNLILSTVEPPPPPKKDGFLTESLGCFHCKNRSLPLCTTASPDLRMSSALNGWGFRSPCVSSQLTSRLVSRHTRTEVSIGNELLQSCLRWSLIVGRSQQLSFQQMSLRVADVSWCPKGLESGKHEHFPCMDARW